MTTSKTIEKFSISQLINESFGEIENAPKHQLIGTDGAGWYQQVGHDHDSHANKSALEELRNQIRLRINNLMNSPGAKNQRGLLRKLELAVVGSDKALLDTAKLIGVTPRGGLYQRIKEILVETEGLDPDSALWRLLGVES